MFEELGANETIPAGGQGGWKTVMVLTLKYLCVAIAVVMLFRHALMMNYIPSESMQDTVMAGDFVISTRFDADEINRYDIMVFKQPGGDVYFIKRVIGLPGERITVENGSVYADGIKLDDSFVRDGMNISGDGIYEVPEGHYFVMGDNRNFSWDSRFWDDPYVPTENFVAHARLVLFPLGRFGVIE